MRLNRREAMGGLAALAGSALVATESMSQTAGNPRRYPLGLQFFTITGRERPLSWDEYSQRMAAAKQMGYDAIELAARWNHTPRQIRQRADELGLRIPSIHMGFDQMLAFFGPVQNVAEAQDAVYWPLGIEQITRINIDAMHEFGCEYGVIGASGLANFKTIDAIKRLCEAFNHCAEQGKKAGIKIAYHMHATDFEPVQGQMPFEIMLRETGPDMYYQLDVCWAKAGGASPSDIIRRYHDRIVSFHLKDLDKENHPATPGDGTVDFRAIHDAVATVKDPLFFVERDQLAGRDPFVEARRSYQYLQTLGWGKAPAA